MSFLFIRMDAGEDKDVRWSYTSPSGVTVNCIDHDTILGNMRNNSLPAEEITGIHRILATLARRGLIRI